MAVLRELNIPLQSSWRDDGACTALIVAHPGHELLLHHWLERTRPIVFVLTDGSGGQAASRLEYSRRLIEATGAACGGIFGEASDGDWYGAILKGEAAMFRRSVAAIHKECLDAGISRIVCDPVEQYNPMHDLANAIGHSVASRLRAEIFTYPIEALDRRERGPSLTLDPAALRRKQDAMLAYAPLAAEMPKYEAHVASGREALNTDNPPFSWPARLSGTPFYERFGRKRLEAGRYASLITYALHVRPLAMELLVAEDVGP